MSATVFDQKTIPLDKTAISLHPLPTLMTPSTGGQTQQYASHWQIAHELMTREIREILIVSSPYNIFKLGEDGDLQSRLIHEYEGLSLGYPPRITGAASAMEALWLIGNKRFDMVLIVPHSEAFDAVALGRGIKKKKRGLPVILMAPNQQFISQLSPQNLSDAFDNTFIWSGSPDLLLAIIKNTEDHLNANVDTQKANVRVIILVEDSPDYYSFFLPILYKKIVSQTNSLLKIGLNEKKKLLTMKTRPKILLAENYEEAMALYQQYKDYLLCVVSDTHFPRKGKGDTNAGVRFLSEVRNEIPEIPLILMSSEAANREMAQALSIVFLDKNTPNLLHEIEHIFFPYLGFGDFIFRTDDGRPFDRASNLMELQAKLLKIPPNSLLYHAERNHFSNWLMARAEIDLALQFRSEKKDYLNDPESLRNFLISHIYSLRKRRQRGVVSKFDQTHFDASVREFVKIGEGSIGGKARGLAFMSFLFQQNKLLREKYPQFKIKIPQTLVICTDVFDAFVIQNNLQRFAEPGSTDEQVADAFDAVDLPGWLIKKLEIFLSQVRCPLSIRSSSQRTDTYFQPYRRLYDNFMIPNNDHDLSARLQLLIKAIKRVYASIYFAAPRAFRKNTRNGPANESMAVIVQELIGHQYGEYFYPAVSGTASSYNFYSAAHMKPDDGVVSIVLGFAEKQNDRIRTLRFSPRSPHAVSQFSSVEETLQQSQKKFYALNTKPVDNDVYLKNDGVLALREIDAAQNERPIKSFAATYILDENRIRNTVHMPGPKVLTFAQLLKYGDHNFPELMCDLLEIAKKGIGGGVQIDFSINLPPESGGKWELNLLQIRPLHTNEAQTDLRIEAREIQSAICHSTQTLGNGISQEISDIVYVHPERFRKDQTVAMAQEISTINNQLVKEGRPYLLVGPGRWGSSDRWLGIPVKWRNISGAKAIVEIRDEQLNADPSKGSHFFNHIISNNVFYFMVNLSGTMGVNEPSDVLEWERIHSFGLISETAFMRHVRIEKPLILKVDGRTSQGIISRT